MKKFVLIPVAALAFLSPVALFTDGSEAGFAAPGEDIEAAVLRAERDLHSARASAKPFAS